METIGKMVLNAILISAVVLFLSRVVFLFPFYMTIVVETFNLSNVAANDNYVRQSFYDATRDSLENRPLFNQNPDLIDIRIFQTGTNVRAIGSDNEFDYAHLPVNDPGRPYRQRGEPITVEVEAWFPFEFTLFGRPVGFDVPVSFGMTTRGLRYYRDLPLDWADVYRDVDFDFGLDFMLP